MWRLPRKVPEKNAAAAKAGSKGKTKEAAVLKNHLKEPTKAEEDHLTPLREAEEGLPMQPVVTAKAKRAAAVAATLKIQLKEEDQKSNPVMHFWYNF